MTAVDYNEVSNFQNLASTARSDEEVELGKFFRPDSDPTTLISVGRKSKRVIYFSDGSTMEAPEDDIVDNDDTTTDKNFNYTESHVLNSQTQSSSSQQPVVDPRTLTWPEWMKHYSYKGGSGVMSGLESAGETLAYYLGITTPKYQHEIDEYNRMVAKKKAENAEAKAWASTNPSSIPIVTDQRAEQHLEASKSLTLSQNNTETLSGN